MLRWLVGLRFKSKLNWLLLPPPRRHVYDPAAAVLARAMCDMAHPMVWLATRVDRPLHLELGRIGHGTPHHTTTHSPPTIQVQRFVFKYFSFFYFTLLFTFIFTYASYPFLLSSFPLPSFLNKHDCFTQMFNQFYISIT